MSFSQNLHVAELNLLIFPSPRRLIGRRFDDPTVKKDIESWPFKVIDEDGTPKIEVDYLGERKSFSAQEISSMVLLKVRDPSLPRATPPHTFTNARNR